MVTPLLSRRRTMLGGLAATTASLLLPRAASGHLLAGASPKTLILGDSMIAGGFGVFLERALKKEYAVPVKRAGKSSSGLSRPDFHDWPEAATAIVAKWKPEASVVMFGGNDVQGLYMGKGEWITWPEPEWPVEYARRVNAFADLVAPAGRPLFWIGMPVMRPEKFHVRVQRVNTIYRAEMAIRPGAHFIDIWRLLANADGEYTDRLDIDGLPGGKSERVRAGDGIHVSVAGAHRVEAHVRAIVQQTLVPAPSEPTPALAEAERAAAPGGA